MHGLPCITTMVDPFNYRPRPGLKAGQDTGRSIGVVGVFFFGGGVRSRGGA